MSSLASLLATLPPTTVTIPVQTMVNIGNAVTEMYNKLVELETNVLAQQATATPHDVIDMFLEATRSMRTTLVSGELLDIEVAEDFLAGYVKPDCPTPGGGEGGGGEA
jgi:hypothetical protein